MSATHRWTTRLEQVLVSAWYQPRLKPWLMPLLPLSALVAFIARQRLKAGQQPPSPPLVPVIVVGNITVGGTGKTPLVAALVQGLQERGYRPGIISRGYGAQSASPRLVTIDSNPALCGDEPVMLAGLTGAPVVVDPQRSRAVDFLLQNTDCNLVISDDGLQHYRLARTIEIAVIDGQRLLGNGHCLPAGPLREPVSRLGSVDFVVSNGQPDPNRSRAHLPVGVIDSIQVMTLRSGRLQPVVAAEQGRPPQAGKRVAAVAGIGHPERFFSLLEAQGFAIDRYPFPDHHPFRAEDLSSLGDRPVIMTAKDAVKCRSLALCAGGWWYLPVKAELSSGFWRALFTRLDACSSAESGAPHG